MSLLGNLTVGILGNLSGLSGSLKESQSEIQKFASNVDNLGKSITSVGADLSLLVTGPLLALGGTSVKAASDFESAFAGVRKTVDATEEEFTVFRDGIRDMAKNMPQAATEIARVAEAAGQLGIQNDAILGFTETMVNMGVATNMSSDEAAMSLARLATITGMSQQDFDRLGATIVGLGNNFAATESEIVEMGLRIAGAGNVVGMTEAQILGFSGALAAVGINAEAGGSAFSKLMIDIANEVATGGKKLEGFASTAGMSASDFQKAFKDDAATAIVTFIEGLGKINDEGGNVFATLDSLGLSEIRLRDALLRSAGAGDTMRNALELGTQAWMENTALTDEAAQRYQTFESQLQIFWNRLKDIAITIGDALMPAFLSAIDAAQPFIDLLGQAAQWFANLDPGIQTAIIGIAALAAAIGPLLLVLGPIVSSISSLLPLLSALTGPVGLVIAGITALVAGLTYLYNTNETVREGLNTAWEWIKNAAQVVFTAIRDVIMFVFDGIKAFWDEWGDVIIATFKAMWELLKTIISTYINIYIQVIKFIFNAIKEFWDKWGDTIVEAFKNIFEILKIVFSTVFDVIAAAVKFVFNGLKSFWDKWGDTITTVFRTVFNVVKTIFEGVWNAIKIVIDTVIGVISGIIKTFLSVLKGDWRGAWDAIKGVVTSVWDGIKGVFSTIGSTMLQVGKDIIKGLIDGIKSMATAVWDTTKNIASGISDGIKNFFSIKSPSRLMAEYGVNIGQGLAIGMESQAGVVAQAADELAAAADYEFSNPSLASAGGKYSGSSGGIGGSATELISQASGGGRVVVPIYLDGEKITEVVSNRQADDTEISYRTEGVT